MSSDRNKLQLAPLCDQSTCLEYNNYYSDVEKLFIDNHASRGKPFGSFIIAVKVSCIPATILLQVDIRYCRYMDRLRVMGVLHGYRKKSINTSYNCNRPSARPHDQCVGYRPTRYSTFGCIQDCVDGPSVRGELTTFLLSVIFGIFAEVTNYSRLCFIMIV